MSHGGGGEDGGDPNRWLVSYADFITLLMVLFVIMWSMGQTDIAKFKALANSLSVAFGSGGGSGVRIIDPSIAETGGAIENGVPDPISIPGIPERPPAAVDVASQLTDMLSAYNLDEGISVQTTIQGALISLSEKLLFTPGTTILNSDAYPVLDTIIEMLQAEENNIRVVGHTDDSVPTDPMYPTNWELSIARAWVIAEYIIESGISPDRIYVSGRGEYDPVFQNDTDENRTLNNRADIVVLYTVESSVISGDSPLSSP